MGGTVDGGKFIFPCCLHLKIMLYFCKKIAYVETGTIQTGIKPDFVNKHRCKVESSL
jgi:hypothetical protein